MTNPEKDNIIIKPSSRLILSDPIRKTDEDLVGTKGELDEDYQNFLNHTGLNLGFEGISSAEERNLSLRSRTGRRLSEPNLRLNPIQTQARVFGFDSLITQEHDKIQEEDMNQDQNTKQGEGLTVRWIEKMTPIVNKGLMKAVNLCGNEEDFLEVNDKDINIVPRGDLDEDYNNFVNDADLEHGGLSDPKARDAKLENPRKFFLDGPGLRHTSINPYI
ncbi:hypothetical protein DFH28DRAFT_1108693 [Melampsora americana]|nr:hypothetical protein DFH28DRAFT_1108693 [Melampsora americana]